MWKEGTAEILEDKRILEDTAGEILEDQSTLFPKYFSFSKEVNSLGGKKGGLVNSHDRVSQPLGECFLQSSSGPAPFGAFHCLSGSVAATHSPV